MSMSYAIISKDDLLWSETDFEKPSIKNMFCLFERESDKSSKSLKKEIATKTTTHDKLNVRTQQSLLVHFVISPVLY